MLTTRDLQELINVDRSTIYRMAETGRLPAVKVGRQWRFPTDQIERWLKGAAAEPGGELEASRRAARAEHTDLRSMLPVPAIQAMADLLAEIFGVTVVITDMAGRPVTEVSNPCGFFLAAASSPAALDRCVEGWRDLGDDLDLQPRFKPSHLDFLCARGFIRVGHNLAGMVIVGGVAPDRWPPEPARIEELAADLGTDPGILAEHAAEVFHLSADQQAWILNFLPRISHLVSRFADERSSLVGRLEAIATLAGAAQPDRP